ncbi:MAG: HAD family hydrolase [Armatimonadota bacterium]|nr:HAD family hydrolase [Armatimonadota bacterium]
MDGVRAIFFDIGDTLVFDEPPLRERFRWATRAVGLTYDDQRLPQAFRVGQEYALACYLGGTDNDDPEVQREVAARTLAALGVPPINNARWQALAEAFVSVPWRRYVHPGAIALLEALRARGFVVGAISDWEETLPKTLAELALAPHLDALAVSATVGVTKPHPQLFQEALRQADVCAAESVHIGDWYELDVQGAHAAGMQAILFDHQQRSPDADCPRVETFDALAALLLEGTL